MADATRRKKRCGNDAPWKAGKTQQPSFPLFPPPFHRAGGEVSLKETEEENMKPKQNST
jgi:hypothetical protein